MRTSGGTRQDRTTAPAEPRQRTHEQIEKHRAWNQAHYIPRALMSPEERAAACAKVTARRRPVASLSPEDLAKRRAFDRDAKRRLYKSHPEAWANRLAKKRTRYAERGPVYEKQREAQRRLDARKRAAFRAMTDEEKQPIRAKRRAYFQANKQRILRNGGRLQIARRARVTGALFELYGQRCACCGVTERQFLTFDHVNGDGNAERARARADMTWKSRLLARCASGVLDPAYQVLCWNCNCARGFFGYCHGAPAEAT